jgi:hypothetical protein
LTNGKVQKKRGKGQRREKVDMIKMMGIALMNRKNHTVQEIRVYMVENISMYSCEATLIFTN